MDLESKESSLKKYAYAVYILQALSFIGLLFMPIIGVMINYIKGDDVSGTWLESHFSWQKRTFWYGLLWFVLGYLTYIIIGCCLSCPSGISTGYPRAGFTWSTASRCIRNELSPSAMTITNRIKIHQL